MVTPDRTQMSINAVSSAARPYLHRRAARLSVTPENPTQHTRHHSLLLASPSQRRLAPYRGTCQQGFLSGHSPDKCWPGAPVLKM